MDTRDIIKATESTKRLVQDDEYYRFIFKKTEKIISVIFFVSNSIEVNQKTTLVLQDILDAARAAHAAMLHTLEARAHVAEEPIRAAAHKLIALDSRLRVAVAVDLVSPEVLHVLAGEIDGVLRGLNKYLVRTTAFDDLQYRVSAAREEGPRERRERSSERPGGSVSPAEKAAESDRRERIKVVLSAKGEATIKDISDIITDVSSKTIQRELSTMIEDNLVQRQGERRWSKYSLK